MSVTYEQAKWDVHKMAGEVMEQHHGKRLRFADGVFPTLCILMANSSKEEPNGSAVMLHGYPCQAVISVIPYKQRVDKRADVEIIIDEKNWHDLTEPQQRALLDHEITHLEFDVDLKTGIVKTDDAGRPKLKTRTHDYQIGGFREIARRYGADAPEVITARDFAERFGDDVLKPNESSLFV